MVAVELDLDTLDAADHSAVEADMGVAVGYCVAEMVAIAEGTDSIVEMVVGYFSIVTAYSTVIVGVVADMEAVDTVATVADSALEVVVDTVAREEAVVVIETSYEFLSTKKYTVAYYTRSRRDCQQASSIHNSWRLYCIKIET